MAIDMRRPLLAAIQAALDEVQAEPPKKRRRFGAGSALVLGAGLYTAGRVAVRGRGRDLLAAVEDRLPHPDQASGDEDEQFDDEPEDDEPDEDAEDDEPEAEADEDDEPEAEADEGDEPEAEADEDDEPEAEADDDEPEAEANDDESPAPKRGRGKARSRR